MTTAFKVWKFVTSHHGREYGARNNDEVCMETYSIQMYVCVCMSFCERNDSQPYVISIPDLYGSKFHSPHTHTHTHTHTHAHTHTHTQHTHRHNLSLTSFAVCLSLYSLILEKWFEASLRPFILASFLIYLLTVKISTGRCVCNETRQAMDVCVATFGHGKTIRITYSECVSVALVIQHAKGVHCIMSYVVCLPLPCFSTLPHKR